MKENKDQLFLFNENKKTVKSKSKTYDKEYYRKINREYRLKNKEKEKKRKHLYYFKNRDYIRNQIKEYRNNHKKEYANANKKWKKRIEVKLLIRLRGRHQGLRRHFSETYDIIYGQKTIDIIGCSMEHLMLFLECHFHDNTETGEKMSWDNFNKWHIDHWIPCNKINKDNILEILNYNNLYPAWPKENISNSKNNIVFNVRTPKIKLVLGKIIEDTNMVIK